MYVVCVYVMWFFAGSPQLLMVVSLVLERNPELEFQEKVDLDQLVREAFSDFQRDRGRADAAQSQVSEQSSSIIAIAIITIIVTTVIITTIVITIITITIIYITIICIIASPSSPLSL